MRGIRGRNTRAYWRVLRAFCRSGSAVAFGAWVITKRPHAAAVEECDGYTNGASLPRHSQRPTTAGSPRASVDVADHLIGVLVDGVLAKRVVQGLLEGTRQQLRRASRTTRPARCAASAPRAAGRGSDDTSTSLQIGTQPFTSAKQARCRELDAFLCAPTPPVRTAQDWNCRPIGTAATTSGSDTAVDRPLSASAPVDPPDVRRQHGGERAPRRVGGQRSGPALLDGDCAARQIGAARGQRRGGQRGKAQSVAVEEHP